MNEVTLQFLKALTLCLYEKYKEYDRRNNHSISSDHIDNNSKPIHWQDYKAQVERES